MSEGLDCLVLMVVGCGGGDYSYDAVKKY